MPRASNYRKLVLPPVSDWQLRLFSRYVAFYLRRHFHKLHFRQAAPLSVLQGRPVLVCLNHPSWWDPLVALYLSQRLFEGRRQYAPIAAKGLEKYRIFERFGFFGIDRGSLGGAQKFLAIGRAVLALNDGVLWVTAQGHFTDVRSRPVTLENGIGHLVAGVRGELAILPLALEYAFWDERTPEAFVAAGEPLVVTDGKGKKASEWTAEIARQLERTQDGLSRLVMQRDTHLFEPLLQGKAGVGGVYDIWRAGKAVLRGRRFRAEHGSSAS